VGYLDTIMEGSHRPGHFKGVAQVVKRLLDIVEPNMLYLGQKDFQQFKVVEKMIRDLNIPVELRMAETVREADGLAMSSRNRRLDVETRKNAAVIYSVLKNAITQLHKKSVQEIKAEAIQTLSAIPGAQPEYFEIADADSLELLSSVDVNKKIVICTATWLNGVRLIDNLLNY
jgi:pantoate--beta-alanine ligase